jgi:hypothetical protein
MPILVGLTLTFLRISFDELDKAVKTIKKAQELMSEGIYNLIVDFF